jgi:hypothetical protein
MQPAFLKFDSAEKLRQLVRRGGFALPVALPWHMIARASLLASRISHKGRFFSRIDIYR